MCILRFTVKRFNIGVVSRSLNRPIVHTFYPCSLHRQQTTSKGVKQVLKIALCDDDATYCGYLHNLLSDVIKKDVSIDVYHIGTQLLSNIDHGELYDIIFLDVQMEEIDGNELGRLIRQKDQSALIVYCSGVQFSVPPEIIREASPFSYLLKTTSKENMIAEIKCVYEAYLSKQQRCLQHAIFDSTDDGKVKIMLNDIVYFANEKRSVRRKVFIRRVGGNNLYIEESLQQLYERLSNKGFEFPHNSFLVNLFHVYIASKKKKQVILDNGDILQMSRSKSELFSERFSRFIGMRDV